jgi:hypothetical protein
MKAAAIAICCLLLIAIGWSESVEVEPAPQQSSRHVRIAVVMQGKPAKGVKVDFYPHGTLHATFEAQSDSRGMVITPKLAAGDYEVVAALDKDIHAFLSLKVVQKRGVSPFAMDLTGSYYQAHPEFGLAAYRGKEEPVRDHIQTFEGIVLDQSGAAVPGTKIRVLKMGAEGKDFMISLESGPDGHFAAQLAEGRYIAYFFANGFSTGKAPFEITKYGSGGHS